MSFLEKLASDKSYYLYKDGKWTNAPTVRGQSETRFATENEVSEVREGYAALAREMDEDSLKAGLIKALSACKLLAIEAIITEFAKRKTPEPVVDVLTKHAIYPSQQLYVADVLIREGIEGIESLTDIAYYLYAQHELSSAAFWQNLQPFLQSDTINQTAIKSEVERLMMAVSARSGARPSMGP